MTARIVSGPAGVAECARVLRGGGLVAVPTETVYGLAGCALEPMACAGIFDAKARPLSDPLIVHLPGIDWLECLAEVSPTARRLAAAFWPGPLTLVLPRRERVPDLVCAGQSTVALRWSAHPVLQSLLDSLGEPVAAPSANRFGRISPTRPEHVLEELGGRIPLILDGGPCLHGIESTIVLVRDDRISILRRGPIGPARLAEFGKLFEPGQGPSVPGSLAAHYAPRTPLRLVREIPTPGANTGLLAWSAAPTAGFAKVEILSAGGDAREAATNLYAAMRALDSSGLDEILAESPPPGELADAIRERLEKAAAAHRP